MDLQTILTVLEAEVCSRRPDMGVEILHGCGADLMSDVLAYSRPGSLLMTGLIHPQVVRTAEMAGVAAIVFVRGKIPPLETIKLASQIGIPLLASRYTMFETCGRLYSAGLSASTLFETILKQWHEAFDATKKRDDARS